MAVPVPPVPYKTPVLDDNGFLTIAWSKWFREIFSRMGGTLAESNTELASSQATSLAVVNTAISTLQTQVALLSANELGIGRQL